MGEGAILKKDKKILKVWIVLSFALLSALSFLFQNCSKTSFSEASSSDDQGVFQEPEVRLKTIYPETTTSQTNQKVKVLIVVDNSATMQNSQQNLAANLNALTNEISQFEADVQVVSTTYSTEDCIHVSATNRPACRSSSLYTYNFYNSSPNITDPTTGQVYIGFGTSQSLSQNVIETFSFQKNQSLEQRNAVKMQISDKIRTLGTTGTDYESPFAVAVSQANRFFNENDRGLIFIITDENDAYSIESLSRPLSRYFESANISSTVPGYVYTVRNTPGFSSSGSCNTVNEIGQVTGTSFIGLGQNFFTTSADCEQHALNSRPLCSLTCQSYTGFNSGSGPLGESTLTQVCNELTSRLLPGQTLTQCQASSYIQTSSIQGQNYENYLFGVTRDQLDSAWQISNGKRNLFVDRFKERVLSRLKEKYLISIATNKPGSAGCTMSTGQTVDSFFTSIKSSFPERNFSIQSICDTAGVSSEGIAKVAADFVSIISTKYLVGLTQGERITEARLKLRSSGQFQVIEPDVDYEVRNGEFILLNSSLQDFSEIELRIRKQ